MFDRFASSEKASKKLQVLDPCMCGSFPFVH